MSGSEIFQTEYKNRPTVPLAQIHFDVVISAIVHKLDSALRSPCRIDAYSIDLDTVHRHTDHLLRFFTNVPDDDVIGRH